MVDTRRHTAIPDMLTVCLYVLLITGMVTETEGKPRYKPNIHPRQPVTSRNRCDRNQYTCRVSPYCHMRQVCIPRHYLCDGPKHCPMGDDERLCDFIKPTRTVTESVETTVQLSTSTTVTLTFTHPPVAAVTMASVVSSEYQTLERDTYLIGGHISKDMIACSTHLALAENENHFTYVDDPQTATSTYYKTLNCGPTVLYP